MGQGYVQHEFEVLGFNRKHRPSLFEEGVEIIRRAWEEGPGLTHEQALKSMRLFASEVTPRVRDALKE